MQNRNGAASSEKLSPKLASATDPDVASSDRAIAQATALSSLAVAGGLISRTVLDISQSCTWTARK